MKRTLNYTGRKRLTNKNYGIKVIRNGNHLESFEARLQLQDLQLPPNTKLYVEAYHLSDYARYDFGDCSNPVAAGGTDLTRLGYQENLSFRILAVDESGKVGRIVAMADRIKPEKVGGEAKEETLLKVEFKNIGRQVWLMRYSDDGEPIMVVNESLRSAAKTDIRFFIYIYPAAMREILNHLIYVTRIEDINEPDEWQKDWLAFCKQLTGNAPLPESLNPKADEFKDAAVTRWIDEAVAGFCNWRKSEWDRFVKLTEEE